MSTTQAITGFQSDSPVIGETSPRKHIVVVLIRSSSKNISVVGAFTTMNLARRFILSRGTASSVVDNPLKVSARFPGNWALYTWLCDESGKCEPGVLSRDLSKPLVVIISGYSMDGSGYFMDGHRWVESICPDFDAAQGTIRGKCPGGVSLLFTLPNSSGQSIMTATGYGESGRKMSFTGYECRLDVPLFLPGPGLPSADLGAVC